MRTRRETLARVLCRFREGLLVALAVFSVVLLGQQARLSLEAGAAHWPGLIIPAVLLAVVLAVLSEGRSRLAARSFLAVALLGLAAGTLLIGRGHPGG